MNYADLPVSERIKYAAEYTLILKDDPINTPEKIIAELATTFFLTNEQASEAYLLSRKQFAEEYKKAGKAKAWHYTILVSASIVIGIFYLFMAGEPGLSSFFILALLFLISALGIVSLIINNLSENFLLRHPNFKLPKKNLILQLLPVSFFCSIGLLGQFLFGSIIKQKDIIVKPLVLSARIEKLRSAGKSPYYYYNFSVVGYEKSFHFNESDYELADTLPDFKNYHPGDTVYLEVLKEDVKDFHKENIFSKYNRIIGIELNGKSNINYRSRYESIKENRKYWLRIVTFAFVINLLLAFFLINRIHKQHKQI